MSFGERPGWGMFIVECVFYGGGGGCGRLGVLERFLVDLRERRADFLRPTASVESDGLRFLVGRWRDWRRS